MLAVAHRRVESDHGNTSTSAAIRPACSGSSVSMRRTAYSAADIATASSVASARCQPMWPPSSSWVSGT